MLVALRETLLSFLQGIAPSSSYLRQASIDFSVPDKIFRDELSILTLNLYLYDLRENLEQRRTEPWVERNSAGRAARRPFPALVDCSYCVTAWSPSERTADPTGEEHALLGDVLRALLKNKQIPAQYWHADIGRQIPPYPTVVAHPDVPKQTEFWTALGHPPKPSLTYLVTVAVPLHDASELGAVVGPDESAIVVRVEHQKKKEPLSSNS